MSSLEEEITSDPNDHIDLCSICFSNVQNKDEGNNINKKLKRSYTCLPCRAMFCDNCLGAYVRIQVANGTAQVECAKCDVQLEGEVVQEYLQGYPLLQQRSERLGANANSGLKIKSCPNCCHLAQVVDEKNKLIECAHCGQDWCFACHAPWHKGTSCRAFQRGSKLFIEWANASTRGSANARACPKCGVFIQRSVGCDHMTCSLCKTPFCYLCGQRILSFKLLGNHWNKYSVLGCRYIYKRDRPALRRAVRGVVLLPKLICLPVLAAVFISVSPFYGAYRITRCVCRSKSQTCKVI